MADGRRDTDDDPFAGESILDALTSDPRARERRRRPGDRDRDPDDVRRERADGLRQRALGRGREADARRSRLAEIQTLIAGRHRLPARPDEDDARTRGPARDGDAPVLRPGGATRDPHVRERPTDPDLADEIEFAQDLQAVTPRVLVTPLVVGLNVGVFAVLVLAFGVPLMNPGANDLLTWGANFAPLTTAGEWWRLVTCMFLHFGLIHIGFNMWVLKQVGPMVERLLGSPGFLVMYLGSGVVGSLLSTWFNPDVVSAGASGAVFGVIGALLGVLVLGHGVIPRATLARLRRSVFTFVLLNVYLGFSVPGIDMAAHLGGLGMGLVCGMVMVRPDMLVTAEGRGGRDLTAVALCGLAVMWLLVAVPDAAGGDVQVFLDADRADRQVAREFRDHVLDYDRGVLDARAFADELDALLDRIADTQRQVEAAEGGGRAPLPELARLLHWRRLAYEDMLEHLRTGDPNWRDEYRAKQRTVDELEAGLR